MASPNPSRLLKLMSLPLFAGIAWFAIVCAACAFRGGPIESTGVYGAVATAIGSFVFGAATLVAACAVGAKVRKCHGIEPRCVICGYRVGESIAQPRAPCCPECGTAEWDDRGVTPPSERRVAYAVLAHQILGLVMIVAGILALLLVPGFAGAAC